MATEMTILAKTPEALALSKVEPARMLGVSLRTVDRLIAMKHLQVRRLGGEFSFHATAFRTYCGQIILRKPLANLAARL